MPPKAKITKEMIIDAGFQIVKEEGVDKLTARNISGQLKCSTQPVLYYFATVEEIKKAVYQKVDEYHSNYIMSTEKDYGNPMLTIGMNYIRFAMEESKLFRFLFQTNEFSGANLSELISQEEMTPLVSVFQQEIGASQQQVEEIFTTVFIFVHGYASLLANNAMICTEEELISKLEKVFEGAVYAKEKRV